MTDPLTDVCPRCHGSPVTVTGTPPNHVITVCELCLGSAGVTPVDLLGAEITSILAVCCQLQAANTALQQELAEVMAWPLPDRARVQASLGATIGMRTAALQAGKVWELVEQVIRLLVRASAEIKPDRRDSLAWCNLWARPMERLVVELVGAGVFPPGYRRFQK